MTRAEIDTLLAVDCAPHIRLAMVLMSTTGARVSAVLELTWDRVDFERGKIDLRVAEGGQRKGRAVVRIKTTLKEALLAAKRGAQCEHVIEWSGRPVGKIDQGFKRAVVKAGLKDVSPHVMRHTAAVHMAEAGIGMHEISQYLGHSDERTKSSIYARFSPNHLRGAASALEFGVPKVHRT